MNGRRGVGRKEGNDKKKTRKEIEKKGNERKGRTEGNEGRKQRNEGMKKQGRRDDRSNGEKQKRWKGGKEGRRETGTDGRLFWVANYMERALGMLGSLGGFFGVTLGSLEVTLG